MTLGERAAAGSDRAAALRHARVALRTPAPPDRLLEIYVADHLAAATAGLELARRSARNNSESSFGEPLQRLAAEIAEDRRTLQQLVAALGFRESKVKTAAAWAAERLGRLKLNGQVTGYSPLSRVLELEALLVGVAGKRALWQALGALPTTAERLSRFDLDGLEERAVRQQAEVEELRLRAVRDAFGG